MIFHILVGQHLGDTHTVHVCSDCAVKSPLPPLRAPGDGSRCPDTGRPLAGPVRTYESGTVRCSQCGISDARTGYLRTCAGCSRFYLLDYGDGWWPPRAWFCIRKACQEAAGRSRAREESKP